MTAAWLCGCTGRWLHGHVAPFNLPPVCCVAAGFVARCRLPLPVPTVLDHLPTVLAHLQKYWKVTEGPAIYVKHMMHNAATGDHFPSPYIRGCTDQDPGVLFTPLRRCELALRLCGWDKFILPPLPLPMPATTSAATPHGCSQPPPPPWQPALGAGPPPPLSPLPQKRPLRPCVRLFPAPQRCSVPRACLAPNVAQADPRIEAGRQRRSAVDPWRAEPQHDLRGERRFWGGGAGRSGQHVGIGLRAAVVMQGCMPPYPVDARARWHKGRTWASDDH